MSVGVDPYFAGLFTAPAPLVGGSSAGRELGCGMSHLDALQVPVPTGSVTDLTAEMSMSASVEDINAAFKAAAEGKLKGIMKYYDAPIVSTDIVTDPHSSIFDSGLTKVIDNQAKVVSWYDNEWGYSNRLVDLVALVGKSL
jgi:glyceraldehyde 3-phosphate dehydrogenase